MIKSNPAMIAELLAAVSGEHLNLNQLVEVLHGTYGHAENRGEEGTLADEADREGYTALYYATKRRKNFSDEDRVWSIAVALLVLCGASRYRLNEQALDDPINFYWADIQATLNFIENKLGDYALTRTAVDFYGLKTENLSIVKALFVNRFYLMNSHRKSFNPFVAFHLVDKDRFTAICAFYLENNFITQSIRGLLDKKYCDQSAVLEHAIDLFKFDDPSIAAWYLISVKVHEHSSASILGITNSQIFLNYFHQCDLRKKSLYVNLLSIPAQSELFHEVAEHQSFADILSFKKIFDATTKISINELMVKSQAIDFKELDAFFESVKNESLDLKRFVDILYPKMAHRKTELLAIVNAADGNSLAPMSYLARSVTDSYFFLENGKQLAADHVAVMSAILYGCGGCVIKHVNHEEKAVLPPLLEAQCMMFNVLILSKSQDYLTIIKSLPQLTVEKIESIIRQNAMNYIENSSVAVQLRPYGNNKAIPTTFMTKVNYEHLAYWYLLAISLRMLGLTKTKTDKIIDSIYQLMVRADKVQKERFTDLIKYYFPKSIEVSGSLERNHYIANLLYTEELEQKSKLAMQSLLDEVTVSNSIKTKETCLEKLANTKGKSAKSKKLPVVKDILVESTLASFALAELTESCDDGVVSLFEPEHLSCYIEKQANLALTQEKLTHFAYILRQCSKVLPKQDQLSIKINNFLTVHAQDISVDFFSPFEIVKEASAVGPLVNSAVVRFMQSSADEIKPNAHSRLQTLAKRYTNGLIKLLHLDQNQLSSVNKQIDPVISFLPVLDVPYKLYLVGSTCSALLEQVVRPGFTTFAQGKDIDLALVVMMSPEEFPQFFDYMTTVFTANLEGYILYFSRLFDKQEDGRYFASLKFNSPYQQLDITLYCESDLVLHTRKIDSLKAISFDIQDNQFTLTRDHLLLFLQQRRAFDATAFQKPQTLAYVLRELAKPEINAHYALTEETLKLIHSCYNDVTSQHILRQAVGLSLVKYVTSVDAPLFLYLKIKGYLRKLGSEYQASEEIEDISRLVMMRLMRHQCSDQNWFPVLYFGLLGFYNPELLVEEFAAFDFLPKRMQNQIHWFGVNMMHANVVDQAVLLIARLQRESGGTQGLFTYSARSSCSATQSRLLYPPTL